MQAQRSCSSWLHWRRLPQHPGLCGEGGQAPRAEDSCITSSVVLLPRFPLKQLPLMMNLPVWPAMHPVNPTAVHPLLEDDGGGSLACTCVTGPQHSSVQLIH
jgi:hypothetical protein